MILSALQAAPHAAEAVRDTVAAVFSGAEYNRSAPRTVGAILWDVFTRALGRIFSYFDGAPGMRRAVLWAAAALVALIVARAIYVAAQRSTLAARAREGRGGARAGAAAPPWTLAQRAAADGRYTEAAHYLYAALLEALARRERLRLHPSHTAGDYARELRRRSSPSAGSFRAFVRAFEYVAYGARECDRDEYERLRALAEPLVAGNA